MWPTHHTASAVPSIAIHRPATTCFARYYQCRYATLRRCRPPVAPRSPSPGPVVIAVDQPSHGRIFVLELSHPVVENREVRFGGVRDVPAEVFASQAHLGERAGAVDAGEVGVGAPGAVEIAPPGDVVDATLGCQEDGDGEVGAVVAFELRDGHVALTHGRRVPLLVAHRRETRGHRAGILSAGLAVPPMMATADGRSAPVVSFPAGSLLRASSALTLATAGRERDARGDDVSQGDEPALRGAPLRLGHRAGDK
mmetsp:Transcript_9719/g.39794  ORF Transcript_9719/g.39794 Transcript_9719/m.39794 type:complete len:254 (-) Transcript_9719:2-763(-)